MVIRIQQPLSPSALQYLSERFAFILAEGKIEQTSALPEEKYDTNLISLPRLVLIPYKNNFGALRQLIDAINLSDQEKESHMPLQ